MPPAADELARWSLETPETPFLFFRGPRGHFTWWPVARAAAEATRGTGPDVDPSIDVPRELLAALVGVDDTVWRRARPLSSPHEIERPIWISQRPLTAGHELELAAAGLAGRWAIVREPAERLSPELFAWARPTLLAASAAMLLELADGFERLAPSILAAAWRRRRLARLRTIWVEPGDEPAVVANRFAALGASAAVLSFPTSGW